MTDQLTTLRAQHSCPDCSGSFNSPVSHPVEVSVGSVLAPSAYAELRSLIWYRGDLYDEPIRRAAA
jgi:hypothetical protein